MEQIKQMLLQPTSGADSITGYASDDLIQGGEGNDTLYGLAGHDTLYGDAGNDDLEGGAGNDVLIGGSGNDTLRGGAGNDVYRFESGWGNDAIYSVDSAVGRFDAIEFGQGILASEIQVSRSSSDLVLQHVNGDRIRVDMALYGDSVASPGSYRIDQVRFADGTRWDLQKIRDLANGVAPAAAGAARGGAGMHGSEVALLVSALADGGGAADFAAAMPMQANDPRHLLMAMPSASMLG